MQCWIEKTISRVDSENGKGPIRRVTVTGVEGLSKTVVLKKKANVVAHGRATFGASMRVVLQITHGPIW